MISPLFPIHSVSASRVASGTANAVSRILQEATHLRDSDASEMKLHAARLRLEIGRSGRPLNSLAACFALTYEVIRQQRNLELHPCQISGGLIVARGGVAEMATGEGKTLTSVQAAALWGLAGRGMHVVTSNDYLAQRDATELAPIYAALGLSVGCITKRSTPDQRRKAYRCDITYATAAEVGFDFLRDRMTLGASQSSTSVRRLQIPAADQTSTGLLQRPLFAALIDEADSVLIDDARTPLVIGSETEQTRADRSLYRWCAKRVRTLKIDRDFTLFPANRQALLTTTGMQHLLLGGAPRFSAGLTSDDLLTTAERMLEAIHFYRRDKHYTIEKRQIILLDESTDRPLPGRKLQAGLHHCLEAREGLPITAGSKTACQISVQSLFRMYDHLGGMTGTGRDAASEFRRIYGMRVSAVPTHRPSQRSRFPPRVFHNAAARDYAVISTTLKQLQAGRAILIGTPSVAASLRVSRALEEAGISHSVLNALHEAEEADIIATAGQPGRVTIATNIAGRGTDIRLADDVQDAGGLHVILTEMNPSARVDRQLIGRCARQGDPGSYQFLLSLDDELLQRLSPQQRSVLKQRSLPLINGELPRRWLNLFRRIQRGQEQRDTRNRTEMLKVESDRREACRRMGLCPYLEAIE
ncbi:MAG: preprotein translocase subunit SecA [Planctomyces sp.]|nr:preprotein translocase subunit SecA [Planctomyces sp.]